jgi:putative PIN family toxin of toxin-antitoxin system
VLDTNVLISTLLFGGTPGRAFFAAFERGVVLASEETVTELVEVAARPRFDRYATAEERGRFVAALVRRAELVDVAAAVVACRDPKDDKFLSLAVAGSASVIVSGDEDLLVLDPFHGVPILTPAAFLDAVGVKG